MIRRAITFACLAPFLFLASCASQLQLRVDVYKGPQEGPVAIAQLGGLIAAMQPLLKVAEGGSARVSDDRSGRQQSARNAGLAAEVESILGRIVDLQATLHGPHVVGQDEATAALLLDVRILASDVLKYVGTLGKNGADERSMESRIVLEVIAEVSDGLAVDLGQSGSWNALLATVRIRERLEQGGQFGGDRRLKLLADMERTFWQNINTIDIRGTSRDTFLLTHDNVWNFSLSPVGFEQLVRERPPGAAGRCMQPPVLQEPAPIVQRARDAYSTKVAELISAMLDRLPRRVVSRWNEIGAGRVQASATSDLVQSAASRLGGAQVPATLDPKSQIDAALALADAFAGDLEARMSALEGGDLARRRELLAAARQEIALEVKDFLRQQLGLASDYERFLGLVSG